MKSNFIWLLITVISADIYSQQNLNDAKNLQKYWSMRYQFLGDNQAPERYPGMIEVGSGPGYSIPAYVRNKFVTSNSFMFASCSNPGPLREGIVQWGDGTIWMGDYIALLATEWKLLNNYGYAIEQAKTEEELYYALQTLNRLDLYGEEVFGIAGSLNGYLARDDVPSDFYENFGKFDAQGNYIGDYNVVNSGGRDNELCPGVFNPLANCDKPDNTTEPYGNTMSQDQAIGIIYGLSFVAKLVPPTVVVNGKNLRVEAAAIASRITDWIKNGEPVLTIDPAVDPLGSIAEVMFHYLYGDFYNLWTITDPKNGEFVCRGPFVIQFSYPFAEAAGKITGINLHNHISDYIGLSLWNTIQAGLIANQIPIQSSIVSGTDDVIIDLCYPNQTVDLCDMGLELACNFAAGGFAVLSGLTDAYCSDIANNTCEAICDLGIMDNFCASIPECGIMDTSFSFHQFNLNMILKLAAASGTWTPQFLGQNSVLFKKEIYDLAGAVLNGYTPYTDTAYWNPILNSAPCGLSCYIEPNPFYNDPSCNDVEGWRFNNRWDNYIKSKDGDPTGSDNTDGYHNSIDYMLAYNLYRLAFLDAGGPYLPLIDRSITQNFPYSFQGNQYGDDNRPLTIQAAGTMYYNGVVYPDGNVTLIAGTDIELGQDFDVKSGGEFDYYYDYMQCEPNYFDLGGGNSAVVLKTGNPNTGNKPGYSYAGQQTLPAASKQKKENKTATKNFTQSTVTIFPNPNNGLFLVQGYDAQIEKIEVSNVLGEPVYKSRVNGSQTEIDLSAYPKGIYFVKAHTEERMFVQKVVYQ